IGQAQPTTLPELQRISGIGPEKSDRYGAAVIAICRGENSSSDINSGPPKEVSFRAKARRADAEESPHFARSATNTSDVHSHRHDNASRIPVDNSPPQQKQAIPQPEPLTPDQQVLDTRLRAWRATEPERLGLPQFFVLGPSTLRR